MFQTGITSFLLTLSEVVQSLLGSVGSWGGRGRGPLTVWGVVVLAANTPNLGGGG